MDVTCGQLSSVGPVRSNNEDYLGFALPADAQEARVRGVAAVIADGMGGQEAGEVASRLAVEAALAKFRDARPGASPNQLLGQMFAAANQAVYDEANKAGQPAAHGHHPDRRPVPQQRGDGRPRRRLSDVSDPEWADQPADHRPLLRRRAGQARADLGTGGAAQPDAVDADAQHRQGPDRPGRLRQRRGRPRRLARAVLRRPVRPTSPRRRSWRSSRTPRRTRRAST